MEMFQKHTMKTYSDVKNVIPIRDQIDSWKKKKNEKNYLQASERERWGKKVFESSSVWWGKVLTLFTYYKIDSEKKHEPATEAPPIRTFDLICFRWF